MEEAAYDVLFNKAKWRSRFRRAEEGTAATNGNNIGSRSRSLSSKGQSPHSVRNF